MIRSARCSPARNTQRISPTLSAMTVPSDTSRSSAARTSSIGTSSSFSASGIKSSVGRPQCPSSMASVSANEMPARTRIIAVFSMPSFMAIASAVLKPMPRMSRARRYGFSVILDGISAIGLEYSYRACRADPIAIQEYHDFPHRLLLGPGGKNAGCTNRPDAIHLAQTLRRGLDDVEHLVPESAYQLLCVNRANAPDHAGREVFLDTVGRSRRRRAEKPRSELLTVGAVVDPFAG